MINVASDNSGSECNNEIVKEIDESYDGSLKLSSPSGMWGLMQKLFNFDVKYIYLWCWSWLYLMLIMFIFDANYYYLCFSFVYVMYIFYIHYSGNDIPERKKQWKAHKYWSGLRCSWGVMWEKLSEDES